MNDNVAIVNGSPIKKKTLDFSYQLVLWIRKNEGELEKNLTSSELFDMKVDSLQELIDQELIKTQPVSISISQKELDPILETYANQISEYSDDLDATLKELSGSWEMLVALINDEILLDKHFAQEIYVPSELDDQTLLEFYHRNPHNFQQEIGIPVSHIYLACDEKESPEKFKNALRTFKSLLHDLKQGMDFISLCHKHSECPSSENGGSLGNLTENQIVQFFDDQIDTIKPGLVNDIIETSAGLHLVYFGEKPEMKLTDFNTIKDKLKDAMTNHIFEEQKNDFLDSLRTKAEIKIFEFS